MATTEIWDPWRTRLLMQFHITGKCNLRCKHCYREEGSIQPLSTEDIFRVFEQYEALQEEFNARYCLDAKGHINLTGGEPFMRRDMPEILEYLGRNRHRYSFGVLSNGSMLDKTMMGLLKKAGVRFVQLSIDGRRETHDNLRAPGDYERTLKKAAELERNGISAMISFTANRENHRDLPKVAAAIRRRRISTLWSDRLVPIGGGAEMDTLCIGEKELPAYLHSLKRARGGLIHKWLFPRTEVRMNRALQCLEGGGEYRCGAAKSLIVVDEMGRVMPCRRLPILCGDIFDSTLSEIYWEHPVFRQIRDCPPPEECASCARKSSCHGGAMCQSYAAFGDFTRADPGCPLALR